MRIFWKKCCKIAIASGGSASKPRWPPAAGESTPRPRVVTPNIDI